MKEIFVLLGYELNKSVGAMMNDLNENPDFLYEDTPDRKAIVVAENIVGKDFVKTGLSPSMGAEDFAYMLEKKPGSYIWLGAGKGEANRMLHNSKYDFNDDVISLGITYWNELVKYELPVRNI